MVMNYVGDTESVVESIDTNLLRENVVYLAKQQNKKISDIEDKIGVSKGYLSRLTKEGSQSPSIDKVAGLSKELDVFIDWLVKVNFANITKTEEYLLSFLKKIITSTREDTILWDDIEDDYDYVLNRCIKCEPGDKKIFESRIKGVSKEKLVFLKAHKVNFIDDAWLYVIEGVKDEKKFVEVVLASMPDDDYGSGNNGYIGGLCNTIMLRESILEVIHTLCKEISLSYERIRLEEDAKVLIDSYLNPKIVEVPTTNISDEEIPF